MDRQERFTHTLLVSHHVLPSSATHGAWDASLPPILAVRPDDTVTFSLPDSSGGHVTAQSTVRALDTHFASNPLVGPVFIESAEPGDALEVEVISLEHQGWGWMAIFPGFGLLQEEFAEAYLRQIILEKGTCVFREDIRLPLRPFCGEMGVAPKGKAQDAGVPGAFGGNLDLRDAVAGSRVFLPVQVDGALFSCGDGHASQGDGEVSGTGIEAPMDVTLKFSLRKGQSIESPHIIAPARPSVPVHIVTGIAPTLEQAAKKAILRAIDVLCADLKLTREEAYCLCGAAVDLHIAQAVNAPGLMIAAHIPLSLLKRAAS